MADRLIKGKIRSVRTATRYAKERPNFSDAIAIVRSCLWGGCHFSTSGSNLESEIEEFASQRLHLLRACFLFFYFDFSDKAVYVFSGLIKDNCQVRTHLLDKVSA
jgi:hypothetical protein